MLRTLLLGLGILLVMGLVSIAIGTGSPGSHASPYFSAVSDFAVGTAEACPCNLKHCQGGVCVYDGNIDNPRACCMQGTNCVSAPCFQ